MINNLCFADKICSPKEIERKRLIALQRREQAKVKAQNTPKRNRFNPIESKKFYRSSVTGKCYMISNDRFALETSSFVPEIIETFKTVPSRLYGNYKLINLYKDHYIYIYIHTPVIVIYF